MLHVLRINVELCFVSTISFIEVSILNKSFLMLDVNDLLLSSVLTALSPSSFSLCHLTCAAFSVCIFFFILRVGCRGRRCAHLINLDGILYASNVCAFYYGTFKKNLYRRSEKSG